MRSVRDSWWLPIHWAIGSSVICFLLMMWSADGEILYLLVAVPVATIILLAFVAIAKGRNRLHPLSALMVFGIVSWLLMHHSFELRATGRWLLRSKLYKQQLLATAAPHDNQLQHIDWDGWGFAGAGNTEVYLVFDPKNVLAQQSKTQSSGRFSALPCDVWKLRRLEDRWFYVVFYTDTSWEDCN